MRSFKCYNICSTNCVLVTWSSMRENSITYLPIVEKACMPAGSFQISQERIWETSCGKMTFFRSLVLEMNVAILSRKEWLFRHTKACKELIMSAKSAKDAYATRIFQNWKLIANTVFCQHELQYLLSIKRQSNAYLHFPKQQWTSVYIAVSCRNFFL